MQICITGSSGFIGSHLFDLYKYKFNHDVIGIDRIKSQTCNCVRNLQSDDISDLLKDVDLIIHCAAVVGVNNFQSLNDGNVLINYEIDHNLLDCIKRSGNTHVKMVYASSSEVYGWSKNKLNEYANTGIYFNLDDRKGYSAEKLNFEYVLKSAFNPEDLLIIRYFNVSCGNPHNGFISKIMYNAIFNNLVSASDGVRSPCDINCAVECTYKLCEKLVMDNLSHIEYNVGTDSNVTSGLQFAELIKDKYIPNLNITHIGGDNTYRVPDCTRLINEIGNVKCMNLDEIIQYMFKYLKYNKA